MSRAIATVDLERVASHYESTVNGGYLIRFLAFSWRGALDTCVSNFLANLHPVLLVCDTLFGLVTSVPILLVRLQHLFHILSNQKRQLIHFRLVFR
jgi:hypothetical protein